MVSLVHMFAHFYSIHPTAGTNCLSEKGHEQRSNRDWPPYGVRNEPKDPTFANVIALPLGELLYETNDNSAAILPTYGTARVLFAVDAEAREEYRRAAPTRALKRSSTFRNYTHSGPRFRAPLTEGSARRLELISR